MTKAIKVKRVCEFGTVEEQNYPNEKQEMKYKFFQAILDNQNKVIILRIQYHRVDFIGKIMRSIT